MTTTRAPASYWASIARANLAAAKAAIIAEGHCPRAGRPDAEPLTEEAPDARA